MFPASLSRSPNVFALLHLSKPARSQRENLGKSFTKNNIFCSFHVKRCKFQQLGCPDLVSILEISPIWAKKRVSDCIGLASKKKK